MSLQIYTKNGRSCQIYNLPSKSGLTQFFAGRNLLCLSTIPASYVFNLQTTSSAEAKRLWRQKIKESWDYRCAYCGSEHNLTIDHIEPRSKGGTDFTKNCLCACHSCNQDKGHTPWEDWYLSQEFLVSSVMKKSRIG